MFKLRVKASSLVEVTTALIIISVIFGLAIITYLNVQRTDYSTAKLTYQLILDELPAEIDLTVGQENAETIIDDVSVLRTITKHPSNESLYVIHVEARTMEGKLLGERKYLKYGPKD